MNLETEYRLTPQVLKKGVQCFWKLCYIKKRELFLAAIFLGLLASIAFVDKPRSWASFIIFGLYGSFALWFWIVRFMMYFRFLKTEMTQFHETGGGSIKFELSESAAVFTAGKMRREFPWRHLRRVVEADDVLLLLWDKFNFTIIPRDQLSDDILAVLRQNVRAGVSAHS